MGRRGQVERAGRSGAIRARWMGVVLLVVLGALAPSAAAQERRAVLIEHARGLRGALEAQHGFPGERIWGVEVPDSNPAHGEAFEAALAEATAGLVEGDLLLISACVHAASGALFYTYPLTRLEERLQGVAATVVLLLDTCHSGAAVEAVPSADLVLAACRTEEETPGAFITLFRQLLERPEVADGDRDGGVTWAEAFAWASEPERLAAEFRRIHAAAPGFWPREDGPAPVVRGEALLGEVFWRTQ